MRTLQRLRHDRHLPPDVLHEARRAETGNMRLRERRVWGRRLLVLGPLFVVSLLVTLLVLGLRARVVADGLVVTQAVVVRAPALARVAEVLCEPGQWVERGTPLVRLEPLTRVDELRALEQLVEGRRLRLELLAAGGELDVTGERSAVDLVADAERQAALAEAERGVALKAVESLRRERAALELFLAQERRESVGRVASLEEQVTAAEASVARADAALRPAEHDAVSGAQLGQQGVLSEREVVARVAGYEEAQQTLEGLRAEARGLELEAQTARELDALDVQRVDAALGGMDARIAVAQEQVASTARRGELWGGMAAHYRRLRRAEPLDGALQRDYELRLLEAELAEARARLAALGEEVGRRVIVAESDGRVDAVHVAPGTVVPAEATLLSYYDPSTLRVVAFARPAAARRIAVGQACRLFAEGQRGAIVARVLSVGSAWERCPPLLARSGEERVDLRLPVVLEPPDAEALARLGPNVRLKVVFSRARSQGNRTQR